MSRKKEIAKELANDFKSNKLKMCLILSKAFEHINQALAKDGRIELRNFGIFEVAHRKARKCRNPKTGETFYVPKRYYVRFKPSKRMKKIVMDEINEKISNLHKIN